MVSIRLKGYYLYTDTCKNIKELFNKLNKKRKIDKFIINLHYLYLLVNPLNFNYYEKNIIKIKESLNNKKFNMFYKCIKEFDISYDYSMMEKAQHVLDLVDDIFCEDLSNMIKDYGVV